MYSRDYTGRGSSIQRAGHLTWSVAKDATLCGWPAKAGGPGLLTFTQLALDRARVLAVERFGTRTNLVRGVGGPQDPAVLYTAEDVAAGIAGCGVEIERCDGVRCFA